MPEHDASGAFVAFCCKAYHSVPDLAGGGEQLVLWIFGQTNFRANRVGDQGCSERQKGQKQRQCAAGKPGPTDLEAAVGGHFHEGRGVAHFHIRCIASG